MRSLKNLALLIAITITNLAVSQSKTDSLGLPGDNFSLYGALDAFKKAASPEDFEKAINAKDNDINNLDLDGDGKVDYVKVIDKKEKDGHSLILQVAVSDKETQDVAVIEVEKTATDKAHVQIVGDPELYGKDYIVEPADETAKKTTEKKQGADDDVYSTSDDANRPVNNNNNNTYYNDPNPNVVVNVWGWPSVQYMYAPAYVVWVSPWYWGYYPPWWSPWGPTYWGYHHHRSFHYHHHGFYHRAYFYRSPAIHAYYYGQRSSSGFVRRSNQSGFYHERQAQYKRETPPGRRYNNRPANSDRPRIRENTPRRSETSPVRPGREPRQIKDRNDVNPVKTPRETRPTQTPREPKQRIERQPQQPRQNVQPRQQSQPRQQGGGGQRRPR